MRTLCLFWCKNQRYSSLRCRDRRVAESKKAESLRTLCLCGVRTRVCVEAMREFWKRASGLSAPVPVKSLLTFGNLRSWQLGKRHKAGAAVFDPAFFVRIETRGRFFAVTDRDQSIGRDAFLHKKIPGRLSAFGAQRQVIFG